MRRLLTTLALVIGLARPVTAQQHIPVLLEDSVRTTVAHRWNAVDAYQTELGYCATVAVILEGSPSNPPTTPDTLAYLIEQIAPAEMIAATPYHSIFRCPRHTIGMHTHPPTTCIAKDSCVIGGVDAWNCEPSPGDEISLFLSGEPFAILQCDTHALRFYYPRTFQSLLSK